MYYRHKHLKPKPHSNLALLSLLPVDHDHLKEADPLTKLLYDDCLSTPLMQQLYKTQAGLGLKTKDFCAIRSDLIAYVGNRVSHVAGKIDRHKVEQRFIPAVLPHLDGEG